MGSASEDCSENTQRLDSYEDQRVYFVPHSWWKDAQDSMHEDSNTKKKGVAFAYWPSSSYAGPMKIINNIFNSDLVFNLRREDDSQHNCRNGEVGVSWRDYALVPGDMWLEALKW